jgi:hypothetical protein
MRRTRSHARGQRASIWRIIDLLAITTVVYKKTVAQLFVKKALQRHFNRTKNEVASPNPRTT